MASTRALAALRAPRIALMSGSIRDGSFNTQLIHVAKDVAQGLGAETTLIDLAHYPLPVYHQDDESSSSNQGLPQAAVDLKAQLAAADAWIVASPEYNGFLTPLLLNAYTWCSRGDHDGDMYATFRNKLAVILSASPGGLGGMRNHNIHAQLLRNLGVQVLPQSVAIGRAFAAFQKSSTDVVANSLKDDKHQRQLEGAVQSLFYTARDHANREATCELVRSMTVGEYGDVPVVNNNK